MVLCFVLLPKAPDHLFEINELDDDYLAVAGGWGSEGARSSVPPSALPPLRFLV
jgi:hypothetical protein